MMRAKTLARPLIRPLIRPWAFTLAIAILVSSGCGGGLVAPEGPQSEAFLNQVQSSCGRYNIGARPINYLLSANSDDTYFLDETSKLAAGDIDRDTYASDINAFYPAGSNKAALDCIFEQLGSN
jgi:hypothetical protein